MGAYYLLWEKHLVVYCSCSIRPRLPPQAGRRRMSSLKLASVAVCVSGALVNYVKVSLRPFVDHRHAVLCGLVYSTV